MAPELFKVSVPGSLMLMGEHAVLQGKQALVCAVNKRLEMQLTPHTNMQIIINDTRLGSVTQNLDSLYIQDPFKFVLRAILEFKEQIPNGFILDINSEFSSVLGFGSSAAVVVATIAVLAKWLNIPLSKNDIFTMARKVVLEQQGSGSGADIAASVYGGILNYTAGLGGLPSASRPSRNTLGRSERKNEIFSDPLRPVGSAANLGFFPSLTAIYCGYKVPTPVVIKIVEGLYKKQSTQFDQIFQEMHECVLHATIAINNQDWPLLGTIFLEHHKLQAALGTSDSVLDELVEVLTARAEIYGAKISGAGLGDCVIGLGEVQEQLVADHTGMQQFQINIDQQGLTYASN